MSFIRALMDLESKSLNAISTKSSSTWTKTATGPSTTRSSVASLRKREETLTPSILRTTNWDLLRAFRTRDSITKASKLCRRIHITTFRLTCKLSISMSSKVDRAPRMQNLLTQSIVTLNPRPKLWKSWTTDKSIKTEKTQFQRQWKMTKTLPSVCAQTLILSTAATKSRASTLARRALLQCTQSSPTATTLWKAFSRRSPWKWLWWSTRSTCPLSWSPKPRPQSFEANQCWPQRHWMTLTAIWTRWRLIRLTKTTSHSSSSKQSNRDWTKFSSCPQSREWRKSTKASQRTRASLWSQARVSQHTKRVLTPTLKSSPSWWKRQTRTSFCQTTTQTKRNTCPQLRNEMKQ